MPSRDHIEHSLCLSGSGGEMGWQEADGAKVKNVVRDGKLGPCEEPPWP